MPTKPKQRTKLVRVTTKGTIYDVFLGSRLWGWVLRTKDGEWYHCRSQWPYATRAQAVKDLLAQPPFEHEWRPDTAFKTQLT
jgi:hypothetical protein